MTSDTNSTVQSLKDLLKQFNDRRDWAQFHDPKNLAEAISIESSELQELFLWKNKQEIELKLKEDRDFREKVGEELADIICFCLTFANNTGFDIAEEVVKKVEKNDKKYPVEKVVGKSKKYTEYE